MSIVLGWVEKTGQMVHAGRNGRDFLCFKWPIETNHETLRQTHLFKRQRDLQITN